MVLCKAKDVDSNYYNRNIFFNVGDQAEIVKILELRLYNLFQSSICSLKERLYLIETALQLVHKFRKQSLEMCGAEWVYRNYINEFEALKTAIALTKKHMQHRNSKKGKTGFSEDAIIVEISTCSPRYVRYAKKLCDQFNIPYIYEGPSKQLKNGLLRYDGNHPNVNEFINLLGWY